MDTTKQTITLLKDRYEADKGYAEDVSKYQQCNSLENLLDMSKLVFFDAGTPEKLPHDASMLGSWVAGENIFHQLLAQPRLTVDLTMENLKSGVLGDVDFESLMLLATNRIIYLNFRDYESELKNDFKTIKNDTDIENRLNSLLRNRNAVLYIGGAKRSTIFEKAASSDEYINCQIDAGRALDIPNNVREKITLDFRRENPSPIATSLHYTYLKSIRQFLDKKINEGIENLYCETVKCIKEVKNNSSEKNVSNAAKQFTVFAEHLRSCHLQYTAHITAAFGMQYNMNPGEYIKTCNFNEYISEYQNTASHAEINNYIINMLSEEGKEHYFKDLNIDAYFCKNKKFTISDTREFINILMNHGVVEFHENRMQIFNEIMKENPDKNKLSILKNNRENIKNNIKIYKDRQKENTSAVNIVRPTYASIIATIALSAVGIALSVPPPIAVVGGAALSTGIDRLLARFDKKFAANPHEPPVRITAMQNILWKLDQARPAK